jgi:hypothetical protein
MGQSKEIKVGELLANSVEDYWFNPATLGHYLSQQPNWTIDRVMEVVCWIIEKNAGVYKDKAGKQEVSEGLALAYRLDELINRIKEANQFNHIKLP